MTFTYDEADLSRTIKHFVATDDNGFEVSYLDGSVSEYETSNPNKNQELLDKMLEQAIERDIKINLLEIAIKKEVLILISFFSAYLFTLSINQQKYLISMILYLLTGISGKLSKDKIKQFLELKKYKVFLEIKDDIKKVNQTELLKCVEFETIYQKDLTINSLDEYSYREMKKIRAKLNKMLKDDE